jgi:hypothetical protein
MSDVCVIIPMYGFNEITDKCLSLVLENAGMDIDVLIVDDGSEIPYAANPTNSYRVKVLRLDKNSGYTNAMNQGILWCADRYKYILTLNNDTEPLPDFIKILYDVMEKDPSIGIACSVRRCVLDGKELNENWGTDLLRGYQLFSEEDLDSNDGRGIIDCVWIPICSALISLKLIREIGLLDKRMINHCSDNDYCVRAKMAGYRVVLVSKSKVIHHHATTTKKHNINADRDQRVLIEKMAGVQYQQLFTSMPLDYENDTWGRLEFSYYTKKDDKANKLATA